MVTLRLAEYGWRWFNTQSGATIAVGQSQSIGFMNGQ
jgi:hypothetical protein